MDVNMKEKIRQFILKELCFNETIQSVADDDQLLESGVMDSMAILSLLAFLEENYGILLAEEELKANNFASLQTICNLVSQKMKESSNVLQREA